MLTERELLDPNISDEKVSEILYRGEWQEISILKDNPKFKGYNEDYWPHLAKNVEFFMAPWYPLAAVLLILSINLLFSFFDGFVTVFLTIASLIYITYGIPLLYKLKERNRVLFLDQILLDSPYHRELYVKEDEVKTTDKTPTTKEETKE